MPRLDQRDLKDLITRADLPALIGRVVRLRRTGRSFLGSCPFHEERSPSFSVYQSPDAGWRFKCHSASCGERGDALDWLTRYEGLPFMQAVAVLNGGVLPGGGVHRPVDRAAVERRRREAEREQMCERDRAGDLWRRSGTARGTAVEVYLREARGLGALTEIPAVLRLIETPLWDVSKARPREAWRGPAMIAIIQDAAGHGMGVHLTYLEPDGAGKLDTAGRGIIDATGASLPVKKMRGSHMGGAIRLCGFDASRSGLRSSSPSVSLPGHAMRSSPLADGSGKVLAAGEGIETSLSVHVAAGLPVWAAGSLENLAGPPAAWAEGVTHPHIANRRLPPTVPDMDAPGFPWRSNVTGAVEHAILLGDGDTKDLDFLNAKLARGARRAAAMGLTAAVSVSRAGFDFNDLLRNTAKETA